jgi:hypothetical protein
MLSGAFGSVPQVSGSRRDIQLIPPRLAQPHHAMTRELGRLMQDGRD